MRDEPSGTEPIIVTREGPIATLWLNRPEKRNALPPGVYRQIDAACLGLAADPGVRVLVLRGVGGHFSAGADIAQHGDRLGQIPAVTPTPPATPWGGLSAFPKPTVAFITGSCVGAGLLFAASCDLRIADTTAQFGAPPARFGFILPDRALQHLVALVGAAEAKHLLFTADLIDAQRALRIGLIGELYEPDVAPERLEGLCARLTERSLLTQVATKEMINSIVELGHVDPDLTARWNAEVAASPDRKEGAAAFLERRSPAFAWVPPVPG